MSARDNYDRMSRLYDAFTFFETRTRESGLKYLRPRPGELILEIGPGTGHSLVSVARASCAAFGLDISREMCLNASINARKAGLELFTETDIDAVLLECCRMLKGGWAGFTVVESEDTAVYGLPVDIMTAKKA